MPSKYKAKIPKAIEKQDACLPYKSHWKPSPKFPYCTNCGRQGLLKSNYSKCSCGGTLQTFGR